MPFPPQGGALQRSYHLVRYLAGRHPVHLLALNQRNLLGTRAAIEEARQALVALGITLEIFDIPADRSRLAWTIMAARGLVSRDAFDVRWLRSGPYAQRATKLLSEAPFDLVHVDTLGLIPALDGAAGRPFARPSVCGGVIRWRKDERGWT